MDALSTVRAMISFCRRYPDRLVIAAVEAMLPGLPLRKSGQRTQAPLARRSRRAGMTAHRALRFGTMLRVVDQAIGRSVVVRINDRRPHGGSWILDLSREAARRQFEIAADARASLLAWLERRGGSVDDFAFPSRVDPAGHLSTRQYARLVDEWVTAIGLRPEEYGTHSLRRTKAPIIYKATGNLRAIQILLGHTKIENTVRYLGVES
jgi:hypothetical protein